MSNRDEFHILLTQKVGKKKEKGILKTGTSNVDVLPGTLLVFVHQLASQQFILETFDPECIEVKCDRNETSEISREELELLSYVPTCSERLTIFLNKNWLREGVELSQGDYVDVWIKGQQEELLGLLKFKGKPQGMKHVLFGVELVNNPGQGTCDGTFRKERYFYCAPETGIYVGIHRIRKHKGAIPKVPVRSHQAEGAEAMYSHSDGPKPPALKSSLDIGDRIVWMSDSGPEHGKVRWVGILPDARNFQDVTVGVEFDNPVGSGTGKYKDTRLFLAKQNHASLVPILGLIKEDEFLAPFPDLTKTGNEEKLVVQLAADGMGKSREDVIEEQQRLFNEIAKVQIGTVPMEQDSEEQFLNRTYPFKRSVTSPSGVRQEYNVASEIPVDPNSKQMYREPTVGSGYAGTAYTDTNKIRYSESDVEAKLPFRAVHTRSASDPRVLDNREDVFGEMDPQIGIGFVGHIPPSAPSDLNKDDNVVQGVNPVYEYNKNKEELPIHGELISHGSQGQKSSSRSMKKSPPPPDPDLEIGSLVEVLTPEPLYGYIKWIGNLPDQKEPKKLIAGLEMEEEISAGTDGTFGKHRLFTCPPRKGFFVPLYKCRKDKRFLDHLRRSRSLGSANFGSINSPDIAGTVSPPDSLEDISELCGKYKGIQGHHNSCYLDATLLAMYYFTTVFDSVLHRPKDQNDMMEYDDVKQVLKEGIVNPLRRNHYVRADKVMRFRQLLDKLGNITGMMSEEKDPEEFLNLLLSQIARAEPFLHISAGDNQTPQHTYFYQLIMEKDERLVLPTTQQLFELSFLQMGIKLQEVPSCLIIQMPRFGKDYKMYKRILPSLELDITDVLENAPRECVICGDLAAFECKECYQVHGAGLNTIAFCAGCKKTSHQHKQRVHHQPKQINVPHEYREYHAMRKYRTGQLVTIPREKMELFAVICIQTSHYVSFVKSGKGKKAKWIFFDSMADRMGEQSGYNIPEVSQIDDLPNWLSEEVSHQIMKTPDDKELPEQMRRFICDAYICMYQSPDVMMFK